MASVIQSIQQISITISSGNLTATATLSPAVVTANTIIVRDGFTGDSASQTLGARSTNRLTLTNTTTVTATRGGSSDNVTVKATVIEFASGVNSIQAGTITITHPATTNTATISAVGANAFVLLQGGETATALQDLTQHFPSVVLTNSTTVTAEVTPTNSTTIVVGYMVVDLDSTIVAAVEARYLTVSDTTTSRTDTITSSAVNDTLLFFNGLQGVSGGRGRTETVELTNATTATLTRVGTGTGQRGFRYTAVRFNSACLQSAVQRGTITLSAQTSNTATISAVTASLAFVNFCCIRGASANINVGAMSVELTNGTTVTAALNSSGAGVLSYEVLEFAPTAGGGVIVPPLRGPTESYLTQGRLII